MHTSWIMALGVDCEKCSLSRHVRTPLKKYISQDFSVSVCALGEVVCISFFFGFKCVSGALLFI